MLKYCSVIATHGQATGSAHKAARPHILRFSETDALTPRELDVLQLAAHDFSGSAIAICLGVSRATVRTHFEHIYAKLGVRSRGGAVAEGLRLGLID